MTLQVSAQKQLRQFVEAIEGLEADRRALGADISDKFKEAKATGFDVKVMKQALKLRRMSKTERQEQESVLDVYLHALGMLDGTPLGQAAVAREFGESAAAAA
jgi:uncharacterized protein (UPF0335 family)